MINQDQLLLWTFIFMRCTGFILMNPILGRRTIPPIVKSGFIMALSMLIYVYSPMQTIQISGFIEYVMLLIKELMVGYLLGYVMQLFAYICIYAGGIVDFQLGLSMAMIYDPQNNSQVSLTGNIFNTLMILIFFAVDGHLALIKIFMELANIIPYSAAHITPNSMSFLLSLFTECTVLAVKLAFPILIIIFLTEMGVGVLMKAIPQINVFVVNIQAKIIIGMIVLIFMFSPIGDFLNSTIVMMINSIRELGLLIK